MALSKFWNKVFGDDTTHIPSISAPENNDGAIEHEVLDASNLNNMWRSTGLDLHPSYKNLPDLIGTYREISGHHEVRSGITDICDQAIVTDDKNPVVLNLGSTKFSPAIQAKIQAEFDSVLTMLDYREKGYEYFHQWYVDGRKYFFKVVDPKNPKAGIQELRPLDSRYVVKVREIQKQTVDGEEIVTGYKDFFVYRPTNRKNNGFIGYGFKKDFVLPVDSVVYAHSGLLDADGENIISHIHQAIKPANMIKMLEDAALIYMIVRAPERRVFYIDTGNLPKVKAEQYVRGIMNGFKNKMTYDATTGKVKNGYNAQSMLEDFWMPRREGSKGTEIDTLPGGNSMDAVELLNYFKQNLYDALQVPKSRVDSGAMVNFGAGGTEITREELKFDKFIKRLQSRFAVIFLEPLKTNLILKRIITEEEWVEAKNSITVDFAADSYFAERKAAELLQLRLSNYTQVEPIIGVHVSYDWAAKEVLHMTQSEIDEQRIQILAEKADPIYKQAAERSANASGFGGGFDEPTSPDADVNASGDDPDNQFK